MSAELRAERQGDSLVLRLHHPESRNALSAALCSAALEALTTAQRDGEIRAVVLTGSEHHFCSGLSDTSALDALHDCILALRDCEPLVVAAVEGQARGAGAALALACDLLVAADNAQFQLIDPLLPESDVGGAQWLAAQLLPRPACADLPMRCRPHCNWSKPFPALRADRAKSCPMRRATPAPCMFIWPASSCRRATERV